MHPRGSHRASVVSMHSSVPRVPNLALLVALVCWWDVLLQLLGTILREQPYTSTYATVFVSKVKRNTSACTSSLEFHLILCLPIYTIETQ